MRYRDLFENTELDEMPMANMSHVGDFNKGSSFRKPVDRKLLTSPKALQKITTAWEKTPVNFNVTFVNHADGIGHSEIGRVSPEWLERNFSRIFKDIGIRSDAVNIIFTNNNAAEHVPMTAWMMAHRVGHVLDRNDDVFDYKEARRLLFEQLAQVLVAYYNKPVGQSGPHTWRPAPQNARMMKNFYSAIGKMRSAREGKIRDEFEFLHELFAQYIITGDVSFLPLQREFKISRDLFKFNGTDYDLQIQDSSLEDLATALKEMFETALYSCVGKIFVM